MITVTKNSHAVNSSNRTGRGFKKVMDGSESHRSREEASIQIRKEKKDERLRLKRFGVIGETTSTTATITTTTTTTDSTNAASKTNKTNPSTSYHEIDQQIAKCMGIFQRWYYTSSITTTTTTTPLVQEEELLAATTTIRRLLSVQKNSPVQQVLNAGVFGFLVELINVDKFHDNPTLLFEAAWALTNIASTEHTSYLVNDPYCIQRLISLLLHGSPDVREQSAWCLGNVAGDKIEYRDLLLQQPNNNNKNNSSSSVLFNHSIVTGLIENLINPHSEALLGNVSWCVSNLCRGKPLPELPLIRSFIQPLYSAIKCSIQLVQSKSIDVSTLQQMVSDALWCLSYISDGTDDRIQAMLDETQNDIVHCIRDIIQETLKIDCGASNHGGLLVPSIRCIGNIVSGSNEQATIAIDSGILKLMPDLLEGASNTLKKEICWMLSNVAAGTNEHIEALFRAQYGFGLVRSIVQMAGSKATMNVRKEAIWTICNIITTTTIINHHNAMIVQLHAIGPICLTLHHCKEDVKLLLTAMQALEVILVKNEQYGTHYHVLIEENDGVEYLEQLQDHRSNDVYEAAASLLERFFGAEEVFDDHDENLMPSQNDTTFEFSVPKQLFPDLYHNTINHNNNNNMNVNNKNNTNEFHPLVFNFGSSK